jgi:hypothetical protein
MHWSMMIDLPKTYFTVAKSGSIGNLVMTMNQIVLRFGNPYRWQGYVLQLIWRLQGCTRDEFFKTSRNKSRV